MPTSLGYANFAVLTSNQLLQLNIKNIVTAECKNKVNLLVEVWVYNIYVTEKVHNPGIMYNPRGMYKIPGQFGECVKSSLSTLHSLVNI